MMTQYNFVLGSKKGRKNVYEILPFNPWIHNIPNWSDAAFAAKFLKLFLPFWHVLPNF